MVKKVKKKRIRVIPCVILLFVVVLFWLIGKGIYNSHVKNIFVHGNLLLNDQEIIDLAKLDDYPRYYKYSNKEIKKNIETSEYIEKVTVKRSFYHKINIYVTEYNVLLYDYATSEYILSNGEKIATDKVENRGYPTLVNYVSDTIYDKFISKLNELNSEIINQISEIKYDPSRYDAGRFYLTMNDGNYVYINLSNFKALNMYNDIYPSFDGHIGILYLDSGYGEASEYKILK